MYGVTLWGTMSAIRHYITRNELNLWNPLFIFRFNVFSVWEDATRLTRSDDRKTDAVGVIAFYRRLLHYDCIVLVKQYRPALKAYTIEMPAGELKYQLLKRQL
jgi:hypothetical protein